MTRPQPSSGPLPGDRHLACLDWAATTTALAQHLAPLLAAGAHHLLAPPALRTHAVTALLASGVHAHEIALDHHTSTGRAPLWLNLDTDVHATIDLAHPDHHATTRTHARTLTTTLTRAVALPAHEHVTIALLLPGELADLHAQGWPAAAGQTADLPAAGQGIGLLCHAVVEVVDHVLVAWASLHPGLGRHELGRDGRCDAPTLAATADNSLAGIPPRQVDHAAWLGYAPARVQRTAFTRRYESSSGPGRTKRTGHTEHTARLGIVREQATACRTFSAG